MRLLVRLDRWWLATGRHRAVVILERVEEWLLQRFYYRKGPR